MSNYYLCDICDRMDNDGKCRVGYDTPKVASDELYPHEVCDCFRVSGTHQRDEVDDDR